MGEIAEEYKKKGEEHTADSGRRNGPPPWKGRKRRAWRGEEGGGAPALALSHQSRTRSGENGERKEERHSVTASDHTCTWYVRRGGQAVAKERGNCKNKEQRRA